MRSRLKKILASVGVAVVAMIITITAPLSVWAANVKVNAWRDDVYNQLLEAAKINVIVNTVRKCLGSMELGITPSAAQKGDVFTHNWVFNTDVSTALWVEDVVQGNGGDDGAIWCSQGTDSNKNILQQFASLTGLSLTNSILCDGGMPGLLVRWGYDENGNYGKMQRNCSTFDSGATYYPRAYDNGTFDDAAIKQYFLDYIYGPWYRANLSKNPYLPAPSDIGKFNNVDGYFNYILDFNTKCAANVERVSASGVQSATDYKMITEYDKSNNKVVATNYYYRIPNGSDLTWSNPLSTENAVTSCSGLLRRISELQNTSNGLPVAGRSGGYEGILLAELNDACKNAKTSEGNDGWQELKTKLQEIVDDPDSSEEEVEAANINIAKINELDRNGYIESSGSEDSDGGKIYQCVDIDGLVINVDDYDTPITEIGPGAGDTTTESDDPCYNAGIEGMSWVLCPALNNMQYTASALDVVVQDWLEVDTNLYDTSSPTHQVWAIMRTIANTLIIIVLIAIIFSQLTGYGIDNYGIKKMLPRLIVMAILVNLSFFICEVAIDLANILGEGLRDLFGSIGKSLLASASLADHMEEFIGRVIQTVFAALGIAGAGAGLGVAVIGGFASGETVMAVVILVLALVVIIAAVLLFFIMLGARMLVIILCVATAPVALASYILPNTQVLFKKWMNVFKMALLMYPLCGAIGGISILVKGIVVTSSGVHLWMMVAAMVAPYLPFFMLPSLLRGTIASLGKVGGALTAMGSAWRGGMRGGQSALQNTEAYKSTMERGRRNMNLQRAGFQFDRKTGQIKTDANGNPIERSRGRFGKFMSGGDAGIARARAQALRDIDTQNRESEMLGTGFASAFAGMQEKADAQKVSEYGAMLGAGRARLEDGTQVNTRDVRTMQAYHQQAMEEYAAASARNDQEAMREALSKVKAAQNIMAKTDKGRTALQHNFEDRLRDGKTAGMKDAASHLFDNYGDTFKAKNRGAHAMLQDLSTTDLTDQTQLAAAQARLDRADGSGQPIIGDYTLAGAGKYTADSIVDADDETLMRFAKATAALRRTGNADDAAKADQIAKAAYEALSRKQQGTLGIKDEVEQQLWKIVDGYHPEARELPRATGGNSGNGGTDFDVPHGEEFGDGGGI